VGLRPWGAGAAGRDGAAGPSPPRLRLDDGGEGNYRPTQLTPTTPCPTDNNASQLLHEGDAVHLSPLSEDDLWAVRRTLVDGAGDAAERRLQAVAAAALGTWISVRGRGRALVACKTVGGASAVILPFPFVAELSRSDRSPALTPHAGRRCRGGAGERHAGAQPVGHPRPHSRGSRAQPAPTRCAAAPGLCGGEPEGVSIV
jgi:hypothetical protein